MTRSVHDNFVLGYSVDSESACIVLHTEYRDQGEPFERTDIRFSGVIGYKFYDNLGGVLFDVMEDTVEWVLSEFAADFQWGERYGWPWTSHGPGEDPAKFIESVGASVWRVQSAIGFDGFVICNSMALEAAEPDDATVGPLGRR